ncbi:hypothetical protein [Brevibacillus sp. NL20B1]|uniref:hypothetical protein n=1 Tax=Brevibacillus sp. NL20B1 TaxID=2829799 RepID=UPI001B9FCDA0|nr:hypothetical protein [Brevibacillus sp. NL20B1]MBR8661169.1 hypothetical protein [Brevibacillus sp. NL20B1]
MELVMHEGKAYKRVARHAKDGDQFVVYIGNSPHLTNGKVYAISRFDVHGDPQVIDDDGDEYDLCDPDDYHVLEPVGDDSIVLLSVTPPAEKTYTISVKDSALAVIERILGLASPFDEEATKIRKLVKEIRKGA